MTSVTAELLLLLYKHNLQLCSLSNDFLLILSLMFISSFLSKYFVILHSAGQLSSSKMSVYNLDIMVYVQLSLVVVICKDV